MRYSSAAGSCRPQLGRPTVGKWAREGRKPMTNDDTGATGGRGRWRAQIGETLPLALRIDTQKRGTGPKRRERNAQVTAFGAEKPVAVSNDQDTVPAPADLVRRLGGPADPAPGAGGTVSWRGPGAGRACGVEEERVSGLPRRWGRAEDQRARRIMAEGAREASGPGGRPVRPGRGGLRGPADSSPGRRGGSRCTAARRHQSVRVRAGRRASERQCSRVCVSGRRHCTKRTRG